MQRGRGEIKVGSEFVLVVDLDYLSILNFVFLSYSSLTQMGKSQGGSLAVARRL